MKIQSSLASAVVLSIASVGMAYAQESSEVSRPRPPEVITIYECPDKTMKLNKRGATYRIVRDIDCTSASTEFDETARPLPENCRPHPRLNLVNPVFAITARDVTLDLNGHQIDLASGCADESCANDNRPRPRSFNTAVVACGKDASITNSSRVSEAEIDGFPLGVIITGEGATVDNIEVEGVEMNNEAPALEIPHVGYWVLASYTSVTDTIAEDVNGPGYLVGFPALDAHSHDQPLNDIFFNYNTAKNNADGFVVTTYVDSSMVNDRNRLNIFANGTVTGGDHGIYLDKSSGNIVYNNSITGTENEGIEVEGADNLLTDMNNISNVILDNHIFDNNDVGLEFDNAVGNLVLGNYAIENAGLDISDSNGKCLRNLSQLGSRNLYFNNHAEIGNVSPRCVLRDFSLLKEAEVLAEEYKAVIASK